MWKGKRIRDGAEGTARRKAIEILAALGEIYGAGRLLPIRSAQISGVSYANLGEAGLELIETWASDGQVACTATLNPAGMDLERWEEMGIGPEFAERQLRVVRAYERMGVTASCTCTPYLAGNRPSFEESVAWSESSAVTFANSILGARTNREGGPSALAAALVARTPDYGLHRETERAPRVRVVVEARLDDPSDFGALGAAIGSAAGERIVLIEGIAPNPPVEGWMALSAALPTFGGSPIFHAAGHTPEAGRFARPAESLRIGPAEIEAAVARLDDGDAAMDLVFIGCPHATPDRLRTMAAQLAGRRVAVTTWAAASRPVLAEIEADGTAARLAEAGVRLVADTCHVVAPLRGRFRSVVTDSAKGCFYARGPNAMHVRLASLAACVEAAVAGRRTEGLRVRETTTSCIRPPIHPPGCVARRLNTPGIRPPRALPGGRLDGLGATELLFRGPSVSRRAYEGRVIRAGSARGAALVSTAAISFYGGVDPETGRVIERGHPLEGCSMSGRVLVLPTGKGSTVGSTVLLRMAKGGTAPAAIVCGSCDTVVAVGAILGEIPCVDRVPIEAIGEGDAVAVEGGRVVVGE